MGKVTFKTKESAGQVTYETETIYESSEDFFFVEDQKAERLTNAVKSFVGGLDNNLVDEPMVADVQVTKKTKETKH
jgi:hypothetical protein